MATLSGTRIKNTYQGLLKTSDAAAISGTLKVIQDGAGNDSALSLSSTTVKAGSLQLNTVSSGSTSTNVLVWNSSSKAVETRTLPVFESVTTTTGGTTSPTLTIADAAGTSKTVTFAGGSGVALSRAGDTITIAAGDSNVITLGTGTTAMTSSNGVYLFDAANKGSGTITLPDCAAGAQLTIVFTSGSASAITFNTKVNTTKIKGRVTINSTTSDKTDTQIAEAGTATSFFVDKNGTTRGGNTGDRIQLIGVSSSLWLMTADLTTTSGTISGGNTISEL